MGEIGSDHGCRLFGPGLAEDAKRGWVCVFPPKWLNSLHLRLIKGRIDAAFSAFLRTFMQRRAARFCQNLGRAPSSVVTRSEDKGQASRTENCRVRPGLLCICRVSFAPAAVAIGGRLSSEIIVRFLLIIPRNPARSFWGRKSLSLHGFGTLGRGGSVDRVEGGDLDRAFSGESQAWLVSNGGAGGVSGEFGGGTLGALGMGDSECCGVYGYFIGVITRGKSSYSGCYGIDITSECL